MLARQNILKCQQQELIDQQEKNMENQHGQTKWSQVEPRHQEKETQLVRTPTKITSRDTSQTSTKRSTQTIEETSRTPKDHMAQQNLQRPRRG